MTAVSVEFRSSVLHSLLCSPRRINCRVAHTDPTRTARFGVALVDRGGILKLKQHEFATQHHSVLVEGCPCQACARGVSRARIHALLKSQNVLAIQFLTQHNVCYMMGLVTRMRTAILEGTFQLFVNDFLKLHFVDNQGIDGDNSHKDNKDPNVPAPEIPQWVRDALQAAGVRLTL
jgi:queuine tRNA-ribosyltransferase catalytic subunit